MLTAGDALAKNLVKSQKVIFGSQNLTLDAGDALMHRIVETIL